MTKRKIVPEYEISEDYWTKIEPLLSVPKPKKKSGRPRKGDRKIMSGIFYLLFTGCQWKALPQFYGAPSTYMIDFRNDNYQAYLRACGWLVLSSMISKKD